MKVKTIKVLPAEKQHFKLFKIMDDSSCKLEFKYNIIGYALTYCEENFGTYSTDNQDLMILNYLEALAEYNGGNTQGLKTRLANLVEEKSIATNQQYKTIYKNTELRYLLNLENNIIKIACIEQKLTYSQLADAIGVSESSLRSSVSTNKISKQVEKSIEMYLKIRHLEKEIEKANTIKSILKSWLT